MYARHIFLAICDDSTLVTSYIDTLDITDPAKNKLEELFAIISLYDESNLCTIVDSIKTYESTLASAGLSVTELTIIRSASSVARHSIDYWDGRITAEGVQSRIKICIRIRIRFKTVAIVFADVAGTVKGGLDGGPTLAGMFASGVVSAVSTSGNAAKLFDGL